MDEYKNKYIYIHVILSAEKTYVSSSSRVNSFNAGCRIFKGGPGVSTICLVVPLLFTNESLTVGHQMVINFYQPIVAIGGCQLLSTKCLSTIITIINLLLLIIIPLSNGYQLLSTDSSSPVFRIVGSLATTPGHQGGGETSPSMRR